MTKLRHSMRTVSVFIALGIFAMSAPLQAQNHDYNRNKSKQHNVAPLIVGAAIIGGLIYYSNKKAKKKTIYKTYATPCSTRCGHPRKCTSSYRHYDSRHHVRSHSRSHINSHYNRSSHSRR